MHTRLLLLLLALLLLASCNLPAMQTIAPAPASSPTPQSPPTLGITAQLPVAASQAPALPTSTSLPLPPTATATVPTSTNTPVPPSATNPPATFTPLPTDTNPPAATHLPTSTRLPLTATHLPTVTRLPTATKTPLSPTRAPTAAIPGRQFVTLYLIALGDNGKSGPLVGCGDSAIPVQVELIPQTNGVLLASLQKLLAIKTRFYGQSGLYDALYQSTLTVQDVTLLNGAAVIHLTGTLTLGGVCDNPRVEAQLMQTARQFSTVKTVFIFINGLTLQQALSLK